jgi:5-methylcytosine-specific restriction endonuclease McrA
MEATKLLEDMRRVQRSVSKTRFKGKNETKGDFIKKKFHYTCVYCQGNYPAKKLKTSIEKFHIVKSHENLQKIADYYQAKVSILENLNTHLDVKNLSKGDFVKLASDFKVFPNTHGICYCEKCARDKQEKRMGHVDYLIHILKKRKTSRNLVSQSLRKQVFFRDQFECVYCIKEFGQANKNDQLTVDHKKAIVSGGTSNIENLCTSCVKHNQDKGKMNFDDYLKKIKNRKFLKENTVVFQQ